MRVAVLTAVLGCSAIAAAEPPRPPIVWQGRIHHTPPGGSPLVVSNKLYLNDCRPNGCTVVPGFDDSRVNRSSIAQSTVTLDAWPHGDVFWADLVKCVEDTFRPFHVEIVTVDPGSADHFEVMIGGRSNQLNPDLVAGGVAPFIGCGATDNNVISFVFAGASADLEFLCGAVAQEACHVWGLDHELNALDPMTYLDLGSLKRFQNDDAACGEKLGEARPCSCGGTTQNSYAYMTQVFGAADLAPATLALTTPVDGQWVRPGFPVGAILTSVLGETSASFAIDGVQISSISPGPFAFNAPTTLAGGDHEVQVTGTDGGGRTATQAVTVHVTGACGAGGTCAAGLHCLGGFCLPGASVDGGLGAACLTNETCITGSCGEADGDRRCTAACDQGDVCPAGFACLGAAGGGGGVCWPAADGGGCAVGGKGGEGLPALVAFGFGFLALVRRRRR